MQCFKNIKGAKQHLRDFYVFHTIFTKRFIILKHVLSVFHVCAKMKCVENIYLSSSSPSRHMTLIYVHNNLLNLCFFWHFNKK